MRTLLRHTGQLEIVPENVILGETLKIAMLMNKNIKFCACKYENIFEYHITPQINNNLTAVNREYFVCLFMITIHVLESYEASAQYSPINFFVNLFHIKNSNLPHCFSELIHTDYRKLHKNNGHSPFFLPPIMRSSVGQCRNIRFRQLYASHVIITSDVCGHHNY